jgi:hypothetical protein
MLQQMEMLDTVGISELFEKLRYCWLLTEGRLRYVGQLVFQ